MTKRARLALALCLPLIPTLGGCNATSSAPVDTASDTAQGLPTVTKGPYTCHGGAPGSGFQITSSKDIPAGGDADLTVIAPRSSGAARNPQTAAVRCQVDVDWCSGSSCRKYPLVDFIGKNAMMWQQISTEGEAPQTTFSAKIHNGDTEPHTVRLSLEMPSNWKPGPQDTPGQ